MSLEATLLSNVLIAELVGVLDECSDFLDPLNDFVVIADGLTQREAAVLKRRVDAAIALAMKGVHRAH